MKAKGFFVINKPIGISSQRAVQFVKYWARKKTGNRKIKVGHAGTLDPLATGVLVIAIGREYTKQIDKVVQSEKEYLAEIKLGETSETDDQEGKKTIYNVENVPTKSEIKKTLKKFTGKIKQTPPAYSAIKIKGQEAYKRVRKGEIVKMKEREVEIKKIDLLFYDFPILKIKVVCGKGTYIRSLARDVGEELKIGGYLFSLQRTRVGKFELKNAYEVFEFKREKNFKEIILTLANRVKRFFKI
ncbi:MAG: tRNA pseudouridine(55) synthase TruB [Candidatus Moranbacteria bacterium]|nr:tRNA pseudouridine(55) synthase TruB [Candidatus Moranbacteria bacterium]